MKILRKVLTGLLALILLVAACFMVWAYTPSGPMPEAMQALESSDQMDVQNGSFLVFTPKSESDITTGLIFYPGGRVDYRSYAPAARAIAEQGFIVIIPRMPLNLAVFAPDKAASIQKDYPEIKKWVVGGHSLGGAMAANYVFTHPQAVDGLILWAAYPAESNSLKNIPISVLSISASEDGLSTRDKITASYENLPDTTRYYEIAGGNHAGFGWYGIQNGDGAASISQREQQDMIVEATVQFLKSLENIP